MRHRITGPALRRTREIAEAWQAGLGRGSAWRVRPSSRAARSSRTAGHRCRRDRGPAGDRGGKERAGKPPEGGRPQSRGLYTALSEGKWPQILAAAEAVLTSVPEHPAARQARARAWQQIAAIGPAGAAQWPQRGARVAQAAAMMEPGPGVNPEEAASSGCRSGGRGDFLAERAD